jgi:hypothetical protein
MLFLIKITRYIRASGEKKLFPQQAVEAYRVVRRRGYHIVEKFGSQMAVKLLTLGAGRVLPPER